MLRALLIQFGMFSEQFIVTGFLLQVSKGTKSAISLQTADLVSKAASFAFRQRRSSPAAQRRDAHSKNGPVGMCYHCHGLLMHLLTPLNVPKNVSIYVGQVLALAALN